MVGAEAFWIEFEADWGDWAFKATIIQLNFAVRALKHSDSLEVTFIMKAKRKKFLVRIPKSCCNLRKLVHIFFVKLSQLDYYFQILISEGIASRKSNKKQF